MRILATALACGIAATAQAHIHPGVYRGTDEAQKPCEMRVGETTFLGDVHHPLNERIAVNHAGNDFLVLHPYFIDTDIGDVSFDHDAFDGVLAYEDGGLAFSIVMTPHHGEGRKPESFQFIRSNWRNGESERVLCTDLKYVDSPTGA